MITRIFALVLMSTILLSSAPVDSVDAKPPSGKSIVKVGACGLALAILVCGVWYYPQHKVNSLPSAPASMLGTSFQAPNLPNSFEIFENPISMTDTYTIHDGIHRFGQIREKYISVTKSFWFENPDGTKIAEARQNLISWGVEIKVFDGNGNKIGEIHERVFDSLFKVVTSYEIRDASGRVVAISDKVDWISTDLSIRDINGNSILTMHRPWLNFPADRWQVLATDSDFVDPRLILMIAAYKSSVDNDRRAEKESRDRGNRGDE